MNCLHLCRSWLPTGALCDNKMAFYCLKMAAGDPQGAVGSHIQSRARTDSSAACPSPDPLMAAGAGKAVAGWGGKGRPGQEGCRKGWIWQHWHETDHGPPISLPAPFLFSDLWPTEEQEASGGGVSVNFPSEAFRSIPSSSSMSFIGALHWQRGKMGSESYSSSDSHIEEVHKYFFSISSKK